MAIKMRVVNGLAVSAFVVLLSGCATSGGSDLINGGFPESALMGSIKKFRVPMQPLDPAEFGRFSQCMAPFSALAHDRFVELLQKGQSGDSGLPGLQNFRLLSDSILEKLKSGLIHRDTDSSDSGGEVADADRMDSGGLPLSTHGDFKKLFDKLATLTPIPGATKELSDRLVAANAEFIKKYKSDVKRHQANVKEVSDRSKEYLHAYFGDGAKLLLNQVAKARLEKAIASALKVDQNDSRVAGILDTLLEEITASVPGSGKGMMVSPGFIARDGTRYGFPGIFADNAGGSINHTQIGADVIRILFEALRDSYAPLPVLDASTAATLVADGKLAENGKVDLFDVEGPVNDKPNGVWQIGGGLEYPYKLTLNDFQEFELNARSAEASVAEAVGKAIRGGSWGSLNNEAIAQFVETAAGVIARHTTERAQWCLSYARNVTDSGG